MNLGEFIRLLLEPTALLISAFGVFTLVQLLALRGRFQREERSLIELQDKLDKFRRDVAPDVVRLAAENNPSLAARLVRSAERTRELPNASMDPLLAPLVEDTTTWLTPLRIRPNLLMLAGLVATLLGLTFAISGLELSNVTAETLSDSLPTALSHMGGAFVGSLVGVFWSVLVSVVLSQVVQRQQQYLRRLADFAHSTVAPLLIRPRFDEQVDRLTRAIGESSVMYDRVRKGIDDSTAQFGALLKQAGSIVAEQLAELKSSAEQVYGSLAEVSVNVQGSAQALQESSRDLQGYHHDLKHAHTELEGMFRRSQDDLDKRSASLLEQMNSMQAEYGRSAQEVMAHVQSATQRLDQVNEQLRVSAERIDHNTDRVSASVDGAFSNLHGLLDGSLSAHQREMADVSSKLGGVSAALTQVVDVNRDLQRISEGVQAAEDRRAAAVVEAMEATRQSVSSSVQNLAQHMTDQQAGFTAATTHLSERVGAQISRLTEGVLAQPEQFTVLLSHMRDSLQETLVGLAEALQQETEALAETLRGQTPVFERLLQESATAQRQGVAEQTAAIQAQLGAIEQVIRAQETHLQGMLGAQGEALSEHLRPLQELPGLLTATRDHVTALRDAVQGHPGVLAQTLSQHAQAIEQHVQPLLQLPDHLRTLGDRTEVLAGAVDAQPGQVQALLDAHAQVQKQLSESVSSRLAALTIAMVEQPTRIQSLLDAHQGQAGAQLETLMRPLERATGTLQQLETGLGRSLLRLEQGLTRRPDTLPESVVLGAAAEGGAS